jgi:hypothetical protein
LVGGGVWSGFTWLRIGTVGGLLWMWWWTFGFWRQLATAVPHRQSRHIATKQTPVLSNGRTGNKVAPRVMKMHFKTTRSSVATYKKEIVTCNSYVYTGKQK